MTLGLVIIKEEGKYPLSILGDYGSIVSGPKEEYYYIQGPNAQLRLFIDEILKRLDNAGIEYRLMSSSVTNHLRETRPELFKFDGGFKRKLEISYQ